MARSDVILLGHAGFVGSAIARHLGSEGASVRLVGREDYEKARGQRGGILINAAGSSDRRLARRDPRTDFIENVMTTMSSLVDFEYETYVLLSSVAVYPDMGDPTRTVEASTLDPEALDPYGYHKYLAESLVRRYAPAWLIFRLGPLVGPGLSKNAIFDLLAHRTLYVNPSSTYSYVDTRTVARVIWHLRSMTNEVFNVCGAGEVPLAEIAAELGIGLGAELRRLPVEHVRVNADKLHRLMEIPGTIDAVNAFAREWRSKERSA